MTQMTPPAVPPATCPHCGATNPPGAAFCESCGKALPSAVQTGPRVVGNETLAATAAGQELQGDQLHKQAKRATGALLAVAIITTIVAVAIFAFSRSTAGTGAGGPGGIELSVATAVVTFIIAVVFWGLFLWSRVAPLPAAIVGLVVYATLIVVNVISHLSMIGQDGAPRGGLGVGCLDIIIMVVLAQAISAGVQHRKLMRQQQQQAYPPAPGPVPR